jgi:hypothetical protein
MNGRASVLFFLKKSCTNFFLCRRGSRAERRRLGATRAGVWSICEGRDRMLIKSSQQFGSEHLQVSEGKRKDLHLFYPPSIVASLCRQGGISTTSCFTTTTVDTNQIYLHPCTSYQLSLKHLQATELNNRVQWNTCSFVASHHHGYVQA